MAMGRFQIPKTPSTTNKTIRFPNDVIEQVEEAREAGPSGPGGTKERESGRFLLTNGESLL